MCCIENRGAGEILGRRIRTVMEKALTAGVRTAATAMMEARVNCILEF
jgi:hypothetical protein